MIESHMTLDAYITAHATHGDEDEIAALTERWRAMQTSGGWPDASKPGVPANPERTGPHELWNLPEHGGLGPTFWTWDAVAQHWALGFYMKHPEEAAQAWRYLGPCLTPAEVAPREAAAFKRGAEAMREAAADYVAECMAALGLPFGVQSIRALPTPEDKP